MSTYLSMAQRIRNATTPEDFSQCQALLGALYKKGAQLTGAEHMELDILLRDRLTAWHAGFDTQQEGENAPEAEKPL